MRPGYAIDIIIMQITLVPEIVTHNTFDLVPRLFGAYCSSILDGRNLSIWRI